MSIQRAAHEAVLAINKVATLPAADRAQRLICLLQIQRHVDGLLRKQQEPLNPVSQTTGD